MSDNQIVKVAEAVLKNELQKLIKEITDIQVNTRKTRDAYGKNAETCKFSETLYMYNHGKDAAYELVLDKLEELVDNRHSLVKEE